MITLVNFSHPLSLLATQQIETMYAEGTHLQVCNVAVQLDEDKPPVGQVKAILSEAIEKANGPMNIDIIILPGYSPVAALLVLEFVKSCKYLPNILILKKAGIGRYLPNYLIRGSLYAPGKSVEGKK